MSARPRLAFLVLCAGLFAGCAVGPDYHRPEIALTPDFVGAARIANRQREDATDLRTWWVAFGDPLLQRYVEVALEQNLDIAQAGARVAQARASLRLSTSALLPSVNGNAQAVKAYQSIETPLGQILQSSPDFDRSGDYYEADLGASWEIDAFGGLRRGRQAARADYQASAAGAAATKLAVAAQTADVYVTIRGLQARIAIAREQAATRRQLLSIVKLQFDKGVASELQMRQVEGSLAQVEAQVPVLDAGLDAAMNALDVLLGTQPGTHRAELTPVAAIPMAPGISDAGAPADIIRRRPDLIVAERQLAAANARIGVAVSEYYPKFSLAALL